MAPSCTSIDNLKASVKAIYSVRLTRINILRKHLLINSLQSLENGKALSRTLLFNVHSENQKPQRQNANVPSFAKRAALPSLPRDR